jgi:hypothetical protein
VSYALCLERVSEECLEFCGFELPVLDLNFMFYIIWLDQCN